MGRLTVSAQTHIPGEKKSAGAAPAPGVVRGAVRPPQSLRVPLQLGHALEAAGQAVQQALVELGLRRGERVVHPEAVLAADDQLRPPGRYARWRDTFGWETPSTSTRSQTHVSPPRSRWRMRRRVRSENARNIRSTRSVAAAAVVFICLGLYSSGDPGVKRVPFGRRQRAWAGGHPQVGPWHPLRLDLGLRSGPYDPLDESYGSREGGRHGTFDDR